MIILNLKIIFSSNYCKNSGGYGRFRGRSSRQCGSSTVPSILRSKNRTSEYNNNTNDLSSRLQGRNQIVL